MANYAEGEFAELEACILQQKSENLELQSKNSQLQSEDSQLATKITDLKNDVDTRDKRIIVFMQEQERNDAELALSKYMEVQARQDAVEAQVCNLHENVTSLSSSDFVQAKLADQTSILKAAQIDNVALQKTNMDLTTLNDDLQKSKRELIDALTQEEAATETLRTSITAMDVELGDNNKKIAKLNARVTESSTAFATLRSEAATQALKYLQREARIKELEGAAERALVERRRHALDPHNLSLIAIHCRKLASGGRNKAEALRMAEQRYCDEFGIDLQSVREARERIRLGGMRDPSSARSGRTRPEHSSGSSPDFFRKVVLEVAGDGRWASGSLKSPTPPPRPVSVLRHVLKAFHDS